MPEHDPFHRLLEALDLGDTEQAHRMVSELDGAPNAVAASDGLVMAAAKGHLPALNLLLLRSKTISGPCAPTAFIVAAQSGHLAILQRLKKAFEFYINRQFCSEAFLAAAKHGHLDCLQWLLPFSDVHATDLFKRNALMNSLYSNNKAVFDFLLPLSDLNHLDSERENILMHMVQCNKHEWMEPLLKYPSLKTQKNRAGYDALMFCAYNSTPECFDLIFSGSDPQTINATEENAFLLAAENGRLHMLKALAPLCNTRQTTLEGYDALMLAAGRNHDDCVAFLIDVCDPLACMSAGQTALIRAIERQSSFSLIQRLMDVSDLNQVNLHENNALMVAIESGNVPVVNALLQKMPLTLSPNAQGMNALTLAIVSENLDVLKLIWPYCMPLLDPVSFQKALDFADDEHCSISFDFLTAMGEQQTLLQQVAPAVSKQAPSFKL